MRCPRADRRDPTTQAGHINGKRAVGRGTIAQLPAAIKAPALDATTLQQRTGVAIAGSNGGNRTGETIDIAGRLFVGGRAIT